MNFSAIFALALKYGPAVIGFIQTEGPQIAAFIKQAEAFMGQLQAAGTPPDTAATKAGTAAVSSVLNKLGGLAPDEFQQFLAGLPIPIKLPTAQRPGVMFP